MLLVTHDGTFHADDVLAFAILRAVFEEEAPGLLRTRNSHILEDLGPTDIMFDVGGVYSRAQNRFDHHMPDDQKPVRIDGVPFSSVGLIWSHYGERYLRLHDPDADAYTIACVWGHVDRQLIAGIDAIDNGVRDRSHSMANGFVELIDAFNAGWDDEPRKYDEDFLEAADFATKALERVVARAFSTQHAVSLVTEAARKAEDPRIVVLPGSMPWEGTILKGGFDDALYVIYPKSPQEWLCVAVPPERGSFEQRLPLPEAWAALRDGDLAEASGVSDAIFCHANRFICGARSREGIIALASEAVRLGMHGPKPR